MNNFIKKISIATLSLGLVAGSFATTASADTSTVDTTLTGGSLSLENVSINPFKAVTLTGSTQSTTTTLPEFSVVDATGTGAGWNLNIKATQLATTGGQTLPENSLNISTPTITAENGSSDASVIGSGNGDINSTTGVKLLTAEEDEGMGTFKITNSTLTLNLQPKDTMAGTYTSTVTFDLVAGP
ncbi:WxL domain-containing protein [Oceanobacillus rekensis]|uniref:WxL domain-containing protein n=1 Tax=Oceanobacillus rekensis TaxID=937927 RepID=UPI000B4488F1|nr:WxL domain-containing protein [Oceanobacillus rekensis]